MNRNRLSETEIDEQIKKLRGWARAGDAITKTFEHKDFVRAMGFVQSAAILAERADHHPDIDIRWNKVTLTLSTHSAGGLTALDFSLAAEIDGL
jgi:4a-hydroxytetrahydrobiopterin dehydratase